MISRTTKTIFPGATEPVTAAECAKWMRNPNLGDQGDLIDSLIVASRQLFEEICRRSIIKQTIIIFMDGIPGGNGLGWWGGVRDGARTQEMGRSIDLVLPATISIDEVITYDVDNNPFTFDAANYFLDNSDPNQPARMCLNIGAFWPTNLRPRNALRIRLTSGYNTSANVPESMKIAMKMMVAHLFNNRGDCSPEGACACGAMGYINRYVIPDSFIRPETGRPMGLDRAMGDIYNG